ncbi:hypothetical protein LCGC14_1018700, partial [marine sediment metagenome]
MNLTQQDIRIIEYIGDTPYIRKYYYQMDYPVNNITTVWFETNISSGITPENDTYLYYGNDNVWNDTNYFIGPNDTTTAFGFIRNGNFEWDPKIGNINDLYGWRFSNDVPEDLDPSEAGDGYSDPDFQYSLSTYDGSQEKLYNGSYTFKWGDSAHYVYDGVGSTNEQQGTLFSLPFTIPEISGGDLGILAWRNLRTYSNNKILQYSSRLFQPFYADVNDHVSKRDGEWWYTPGISGGGQWPYTWVSDGTENRYTTGNELEGNNTIDLPEGYSVGEEVSIEFITYGEEHNSIHAFTQVDEVRFNYTFQTDLNDFQSRMSEVSIIVKDIDGRIVPNAEVSLINSTYLLDPVNTSENNGIAFFSAVQYAIYNISVNYTIDSTGNETVVFDSRPYPLVNYTIEDSIETITIEVDIWTIDFEIVDFGEEPMNSGYIEVNYTKNAILLDNITLDRASNGKATFRWNGSLPSYYYRVYYTNRDYNITTTLLNESYIFRSDYEQDKIKKDSVLLNVTCTLGIGDPQPFTVNETFYTNGSRTELGNKKIISANINVTTPSAQVISIKIYYIDKNNYTDENYLIYENNTFGQPWYRLQIDMRDPQKIPITLEGDKYEVYGLQIVVAGVNSSKILGDLNVTFFETTNIYNVTELSKLNIKILALDGAVAEGALVNVTSTDGIAFNTTLKVKDEGGYAFGLNTDLPFWYLRGHNYTFAIYYAGDDQKFNVTLSNEWLQKNTYFYDYDLTGPTNLTFRCVDISGSDVQTRFQNSTVTEGVIWGADITVSVNFTSTSDNWGSIDVVTTGTVYYYVKTIGVGGGTILKSDLMPHIGDGGYETTFNSSEFSAGNSGMLYSIIISGSVGGGFANPTNGSETVYIDTVSSTLSMHDYYSGSLDQITSDSQIFGQSIKLTFRYFNISNSPLINATVTYEWLGNAPIQIDDDPHNPGYYTTTPIDTSVAGVWGLKSIVVLAMLENHTTKSIPVTLSITQRPTTIKEYGDLNEEDELLYVSEEVWVEDHKNFEFVYKDSISTGNIGSLTAATYIWEELYANGTRIANETGTGTLVQYDANMTHILDFKTELKSIGNYYLYITLHRQNYVAKSALINLEIKSRIFTYSLPTETVVDGIITINSGDALDLNITLNDETRTITLDNITSFIPLQNANVTMSFQNKNYTLTEDGLVNGTYSLYIDNYTKLGEGETTTTSTTEIIISKANFTSQTIPITIILNNKIFNISFSEQFQDNLIKIVSGKTLSFIITLDHPSSSPVTDATLTLLIDGEVYEDVTITNNLDGTYTFTFKSLPEAFTTSETLSAEIRIERTNFKTETIQITINIKMTEIFPGVPTFYFILITAAVIGIVGSIVGYRVIQQARIPKHVKKIRKIKSLIKAKKKITESIGIPTKDHMMAKIFAGDWREIGLSLGEILGLEDLKTKKFSLKEISAEDKIKKDKLAKKKLEKEKLKKDKLEKKKLEKDELKKDKLEKKRLEREKQEEERLEKEKLEQERLEKEKLEKEKLEQERLEQERLEKEKLEQEKLEAEELEEEKLEEEGLETEKLEKEKLEKEKLEQEKLETERL